MKRKNSSQKKSRYYANIEGFSHILKRNIYILKFKKLIKFQGLGMSIASLLLSILISSPLFFYTQLEVSLLNMIGWSNDNMVMNDHDIIDIDDVVIMKVILIMMMAFSPGCGRFNEQRNHIVLCRKLAQPQSQGMIGCSIWGFPFSHPIQRLTHYPITAMFVGQTAWALDGWEVQSQEAQRASS